MVPALLGDTVTYDVDRAVHYALLWGLEGIELRTVGGLNDRVPFVNEAKIKARLRESELPVIAVDPDTFIMPVDDRVSRLNDLVQFEETLQFCKRIGCPRVVVSSFRVDDDSPGSEAMDIAVDALRRITDKADAASVDVCVINEPGFLAATGGDLADLLDAVDHESVQAAWSPADALMAGEDPSEGLRRLQGRIGLVRCRSGVIEGNGWEPRSIDTGEIDWEDQLCILQSSGFDGPLCLEVEAEPKPKIGLRDATTLIRMLRKVQKAETQATANRQHE